MPDVDLREEQEPLKDEYEADPESARITITASGEERDALRSATERYCVVYQTPVSTDGVVTDWSFA